MNELTGLWGPIILSAVVVFIASFIAWTISPHHKGDYQGLSNEEAMLSAIRAGNVAPGMYMIPYCADWSELKDPDKKAKYEAGPYGVLNVWPGIPNMGKNMAFTFLFFLVTSFFIAYLTSVALDPGAGFSAVFQVAGTAGILAYCFASMPNNIWFNKPLRAVVMDVLDGVVYGLVTGAVFGWMWPTG